LGHAKYQASNVAQAALRCRTSGLLLLPLELDDKSRRGDHLENLPEDRVNDDVYQHAREVSHRFRDSLLNLFFDVKTGLTELTRLYGVF
jgi:hypothetical protein